MDDFLLTIWLFVRGDLPPREFEQWVYQTPSLERELGKEDYLELIAVDFGDAFTVRRLRELLGNFARDRTVTNCACITLASTATIEMADPGTLMKTFREVAVRGEPYWWLSFSRCTECTTPWLVAQEERQNDIFILRRITEVEAQAIERSGKWPVDLDSYETLLRIGRDAGHRVVFVDPIGDSSLSWSMRDLARDRPGIKASELAGLLNIDLPTARIIAKATVRRDAVDIALDS